MSNRLALGLLAAPYLTWTQYGPYQPRDLRSRRVAFRWSSGPITRPPSRVEIAVPHSQGYFTQRLSHMHSVRAMESGFSLLVRVQPLEGLTSILIHTAPAGPRFDLALRRINDSDDRGPPALERVYRGGPAVIVDAPVAGRWPLLELRYRPQWKSAILYVDGRRSVVPMRGIISFRTPTKAASPGAFLGGGDHDAKAAAAFSLVWLEIFGAGL